MNQAILDELELQLEASRTVAVITLLSHPEAEQLLVDENGALAGRFASPALADAVLAASTTCLAELRSARQKIEIGPDVFDVFVDVHPPPSQLIIVGAVHIAVHLTALAHELGYRTVVIDPRSAFATRERLPHADQLITDWPAEALGELTVTDNTYFALLSHDLKLDLPALEMALESRARYVGALGSKKTQRKRVDALIERGYSEKEIERIHNPIGLDLGGRSPREIALAIMAEIVAVRHGRS